MERTDARRRRGWIVEELRRLMQEGRRGRMRRGMERGDMEERREWREERHGGRGGVTQR